jgi:glycosyltransferase involved in cell wall biosynthesis
MAGVTMPKRYLMLVGDPNDINTWSNTPYYFLQAAQKDNFLTGGLPLKPARLKFWRLLWNLWQLLLTGQRGGFQYSNHFARLLIAQVHLPSEAIEIISHFPLLPPEPIPVQWQLNYYIDATTKQVFESYGIDQRVVKKFQAEVLARETRNFQKAKRIICMCHWAADSVINDYGIDPSKVFVIPGGANLDEALLAQLPPSLPPPFQPLRLGFIGKDWQRKGLPLLLQVAEELHQRGYSVQVPVIGPLSSDLSSHPLLKPLGFLNKNTDLEKFVAIVRSWHFGCLFSQAEASPRSNLECLRLGVPVLSLRVGGIPDTVPEGLGHLFAPDVQPQIIADTIETYLQSQKKYTALREKILSRSNEFTWARAVEKMKDIFREIE